MFKENGTDVNIIIREDLDETIDDLGEISFSDLLKILSNINKKYKDKYLKIEFFISCPADYEYSIPSSMSFLGSRYETNEEMIQREKDPKSIKYYIDGDQYKRWENRDKYRSVV
jgi:hypothetical protein